jgi:hypothetical protein
MTGANTKIFIDGRPLEGVTKLQLNISALGVATLSLEMVGDIEFDGDAAVDTKSNK